MLRRTEVALGLGEIVVLDASWSSDRWRTEARAVASRTASDLVELRCSAPPDTTARRMRRRRGAGDDPSDATPEIAAQLALTEDPWPTAVVVDTSSGPGEALVKALALVGSTGA